jgi:prepilin-type processing-associated H-X9-DG protein
MEQDNLYRISDIVYSPGTTNPVNVVQLTPANGFPPTGFNFPTYPTGSYATFIQFNGTTAPPGPVQTGLVRSYNCPSLRPTGLYNGTAGKVNFIDYACAHPWIKAPIPDHKDWGGLSENGAYWVDNGSAAFGWWGDTGEHGVIAPRRAGKVTFATITDGTSNTFMIGEKYTDLAHINGGFAGDQYGMVGGQWVDTMRGAGPQNGDLADWCSLGNPSRDVSNGLGVTGDYWRSMFLFGSAHPAGMNAVFADGSVHNIKYGIDPQVFNGIALINDGNVWPSDDWQ